MELGADHSPSAGAAAAIAEDTHEPEVADIHLEDDGFDSDVEIIRAQLFVCGDATHNMASKHATRLFSLVMNSKQRCE